MREESNPDHGLDQVGCQAHGKDDRKNLKNRCGLDEQPEKPPKNPGDDSPQEILHAPRSDCPPEPDWVALHDHVPPLLQGEEQSHQSGSRDEKNGVHQDRLVGRSRHTRAQSGFGRFIFQIGHEPPFSTHRLSRCRQRVTRMSKSALRPDAEKIEAEQCRRCQKVNRKRSIPPRQEPIQPRARHPREPPTRWRGIQSHHLPVYRRIQVQHGGAGASPRLGH